MKKKIVLINPPYPVGDSPSPPLGLMALGAFLQENGYEVFIDDLIVNGYSRERVEKIIAEYRPDYAGITGATMNIKKAIEVLACYRDISPGLITIAGGPHVSFDAENILSGYGHLDYVVRGEGELTLRELLEAIERGGDFSHIDGLSYRAGGKIVHNRERDFINDINILPIPDHRLCELGKYRALGMPVNITTSRGCPHRCTFCLGHRMVGNRVRYFDTGRVVDEFEAISKTGVRQINIADDLFTSNKKRCIDICHEIMRRGIRQEWTAFARVDTVSLELLRVMKQAGCTTLCFGIESGDQDILDRARKKINLETCREAISMCSDAGIMPMTAYILGLPGETEETLEKTREFSRQLSNFYGYHILSPFPGTEVWEKSEEYGIRILSRDWEKYDSKHAVSESVSLDAAEVEKTHKEYTSGAQRIVEDIERRISNGEDVSDYDRNIIDNRNRLLFVAKLIFSNMLNDFSGTGVNSQQELVDFLSEEMQIEAGYVEHQVERMLKNRCIKLDNRDGNAAARWSLQ